MPDVRDFLNGTEWRLVGPFRGGRSIAVVGHPAEQLTFFFGACAGGVWKSEDAGAIWRNVSDGYFTSSPVGALAIAPSNPSVIYAATGESTIRGDVTIGDGMYRSDDGGESWRHIGLKDTRHIARVRVHPRDENLVYAGALGHAFGPHSARGVYRSKDGGETWENVLYRDENSGIADLIMDPANPKTLYASMWETRRYPWALHSGGPGSGLFKTTDGGDTWEELSHNPGMPEGLLGRIGVAVAPASPNRVWALVESKEGGLYRSDDYGKTWKLINPDPNLRQRPWYYMHIVADPVDPDKVYIMNLQMWKSIDGGESFSNVPTPHGDNHDLWIDPNDTNRMIEGNDGGACVSLDGGVTWSSINNQPTSQLYHVTTDTRFPYRIYGAQQDNTTITVPSYSWRGQIVGDDTYAVAGGESGYIAVRPDNPDIVYAGSFVARMTRYDHSSQQAVEITVWPEDPIGYGAQDWTYRFQWTFPIHLSPHDPDILYTGGNHVFRSNDGGQSWKPISHDLTRADPETLLPSGGPITGDNIGTEIYATVFALAESPVTPGVIWAGSDDGLVNVTRDNGETWTNVNPPDLPDWALISIIEPSPHDAATAFVAATCYKLDDNTPYLYKTHDYGETWQLITSGLPEDDFTRVVREDPQRKGLLYCGTEGGLWVSWNEGGMWHRIQGNLPVTPIHDLVVKDSDLILATHGRSFWSLDDIEPLRAWNPGMEANAAALFPPKPSYRMKPPRAFGGRDALGYKAYLSNGGRTTLARTWHDEDGDLQVEPMEGGKNPPHGVMVHYYLGAAASDDVKITFMTQDGEEIRSFSSSDEKKHNTSRIKTGPGLHRFVWDMRYPPGTELGFGVLSAYWGGGVEGPEVPPGRYQVRLEVDGDVQTRELEVRKDPRIDATQEDLEAQFELLLKIRDKLSAVHDAVLRSRGLREQVDTWVKRLEETDNEELAEEAKKVSEKLVEAEGNLVESRTKGYADSFNYPPKVNSKLASMQGSVSFGDTRPPAQQYEVFEHLGDLADRHMKTLNEVIDTDLAALNQKIIDAKVPAIG